MRKYDKAGNDIYSITILITIHDFRSSLAMYYLDYPPSINMLSTLCLDHVVRLLVKFSEKLPRHNDQEILQALQKIEIYFKTDRSTMHQIIRYLDKNRKKRKKSMPSLMLSLTLIYLQASNGCLSAIPQLQINLFSWLSNENYIKKKDLSRIEDFSCLLNNVECLSLLPKLKILYVGDRCEDDKIRRFTEACPLLEFFYCHTRITDVGLEYLSSLTKLKFVRVSNRSDRDSLLSGRGIAEFLIKCKTRIQGFRCPINLMADAVQFIAFTKYDTVPSIRHLSYRGSLIKSSLPDALQIFPAVDRLNLVLRHQKHFTDFEKLLSFTPTVTHMNITLDSIRADTMYQQLRSIRIVFPRLISLNLVTKPEGELAPNIMNWLNIIDPWLAFPPITGLKLDCSLMYDSNEMEYIWSAFMFPGNNIKVLHLTHSQLFTDVRWKQYVYNLAEVKELQLQTEVQDFKFVENIVKCLPSLLLFINYCGNRKIYDPVYKIGDTRIILSNEEFVIGLDGRP